MPLAITLELDLAARDRVVRLWQSAEDLDGIETPGMLGAAPHLTLAVYRDEVSREIVADCRSFAATISRLSLSFPSLVCFPAETGTLCLGPVPTPSLLHLHDAFHRMAAAFLDDCHDHYRPGTWLPHVTLARTRRIDQMAALIECLQAGWQPLEGTLECLTVIEFPPVKEVERSLLSGPDP